MEDSIYLRTGSVEDSALHPALGSKAEYSSHPLLRQLRLPQALNVLIWEGCYSGRLFVVKLTQAQAEATLNPLGQFLYLRDRDQAVALSNQHCGCKDDLPARSRQHVTMCTYCKSHILPEGGTHGGGMEYYFGVGPPWRASLHTISFL